MDESTEQFSLLSKTIGDLCQVLDCICGEMWLPKPHRLVLSRASTWNHPTCPFPAIRNLAKGLDVAIGSGSAGRAWLSRQPTYISLLDPQSPRFNGSSSKRSSSNGLRLQNSLQHSTVAATSGAIAELSIPMLDNGFVVLVSTFYFNHPLAARKIEQFREQTASAFETAMLSKGLSHPSSQTLFDSLMGLYFRTTSGEHVCANHNLAEIYGYDSPEQFIAGVQEFDQPLYLDPQRQAEILAAFDETDVMQVFESEIYSRDGTTKWISETVRAIRDDCGQLIGYEGAVEDITARKRDRETIEFMAYYDVLTGLANRMLFHDRLTQAISNAQHTNSQVAVFFIDVDRFKTINDSLGHSAGDVILQKVTTRLKHELGGGETLARWGGDEFALLTPFLQAKDAAKLARRLLNSLQEHMTIDGQLIHVTASIGIALYPTDGVNAQSLMQNAGTALHRAKDLGRNNYQFFNAAMNVQATTRLSLENDLRMALRREELQLYYQPQIHTQTGSILGFEALLRWNHPKLGLLLPNRFIPIAEDSGFITVMTEWILTTACRQIKHWHDRGYSRLHVAVNLSAREFQQPQLLSQVSQVLKMTGLSPNTLELEITESVAMQDANRTIRILTALRNMGVQISIDDFGTGYSSIGYLRQFPCDTLKIDRSFIADLGASQSADIIGRSVIGLGQGLDLNVVAEGVETHQQLEFLKQVNCDSVQGFWFSKPAPAAEAEKKMIQQAAIEGHVLNRIK